MNKAITRITLFLLVGSLIWGILYLNSLLPVVTGFAAKNLCSAVFISHRDPVDVENLELHFSLVRYVCNEVNYQDHSVTSRFLWSKSKAVCREGYGCTLLRGVEEQAFRGVTFPRIPPAGFDPDTLAWPMGNRINDSAGSADRDRLSGIADSVMAGFYGGTALSFLVVHRGNLVTERYRRGITDTTRLLSWSIAKSFMGALAGILVGDGTLRPEETTGITAWQNDDRSRITLTDLLRMQSGLSWNEEYGNRSDVTLMLYDEASCSGYSMSKKLAWSPGSSWEYISGNTNILTRLIVDKLGSDSAFYAYLHQRLLFPAGITRAVLEPDASGNPVGSSYLYATPRDFARFGLLLLHKGAFNDVRVLPERWIEWSTTPTPHSKGQYGAGFWLNRSRMLPDLPADAYFCNGYNGQRIFIIPSHDLVVVVLGYSPRPEREMDFNGLVGDVVKMVR